jgi:hypothetical protein
MYSNENNLSVYPNPLFVDGVKIILQQLQKSICRICNKYGTEGTGFFCEIPIGNEKRLPVFITNNHIIDEKILNDEKEISIKINFGNNLISKTIKLKDRFKYTDKCNDITIIEMKKEKNDFYEYLEIDDDIFEDKNYIGYFGNSIYMLHYPNKLKDDKPAVSLGVIKNGINEKSNFIHYCCEGYGSSGSPILNLSNNKIIGIHIKTSDIKEYNIGLFLKNSIMDFIDKYNKKGNKNNILYFFQNLINKINIIKRNQNENELSPFTNLYNKGLISEIKQFKDHGSQATTAYKLKISEKYIRKDINSQNWVSAWHGTNYKNLESIIEHGLKFPGTKFQDGSSSPITTYIPDEIVDTIKNWDRAIFASPTFVGSSNYSKDGISINGEPFYCVIEVKIKPGNYTEHDIFRIIELVSKHQYDVYNHIIYRISSEENIIPISIIFFSQLFLEYFSDLYSKVETSYLKYKGIIS